MDHAALPHKGHQGGAVQEVARVQGDVLDATLRRGLQQDPAVHNVVEVLLFGLHVGAIAGAIARVFTLQLQLGALDSLKELAGVQDVLKVLARNA